jgi:protein-arginine kinase activator protein McsA
MLAEAVRLENFEDAAKLRDKIKDSNTCLEILSSKENLLKRAIEAERFEEAAVLRDEIRALKMTSDPDICSKSKPEEDALQADLHSALEIEHFEKAAEIRDKLRRACTPNTS